MLDLTNPWVSAAAAAFLGVLAARAPSVIAFLRAWLAAQPAPGPTPGPVPAPAPAPAVPDQPAPPSGRPLLDLLMALAQALLLRKVAGQALTPAEQDALATVQGLAPPPPAQSK